MADVPQFKVRFSRFLSTDGTSNGVKEQATTADSYFIIADKDMVINRIIHYFEDVGNLTLSKYANITALTNGITVHHIAQDGVTTISDLTDDVPIKTNGDWSRFFDTHSLGTTGAVNALVIRWSFSKAGMPLFLLRGERLQLNVNDDLSTLDTHTTLCEGYFN